MNTTQISHFKLFGPYAQNILDHVELYRPSLGGS